jgi:uncharacterized protein
MNILAFTDIHGNKKQIEALATLAHKADLLICCGDISDFGKNAKNTLLKFINTKRPLLFVHGNHETEETFEKLAKEYENFIYLHKSSITIDGITFFGYGGGGFAQKNKELERISTEFRKKLRPNQRVITVTHGPPHGTTLDKLDDDYYTGCKSIRKMIEEIQPIIHLCGHIHENSGKQDKVNNTIILNPGPKGKLIRV